MNKLRAVTILNTSIKKPRMFDIRTRSGGRGTTLPQKEIKQRKEKAMNEMAEVENILRDYIKISIKLKSLIQKYT